MTTRDEAIAKEVLALHKSIRFCGIVKDGKVVAGGMREGVKSLEPKSLDKKLMTQLSILIGTDKGWDTYLGKTDYFLIRKEKINLALFPIENLKGVLVTTETSFSISKLDGIRRTIDATDER